MSDNKTLYMLLRLLIHNKFDIVTPIRDEAEALVKQNRRPLIFANTKREKEDIIKGWKFLQKNNEIVTVVTVHEAAFGLNMQHKADAIITRPHPG